MKTELETNCQTNNFECAIIPEGYISWIHNGKLFITDGVISDDMSLEVYTFLDNAWRKSIMNSDLEDVIKLIKLHKKTKFTSEKYNKYDLKMFDGRLSTDPNISQPKAIPEGREAYYRLKIEEFYEEKYDEKA